MVASFTSGRKRRRCGLLPPPGQMRLQSNELPDCMQHVLAPAAGAFTFSFTMSLLTPPLRILHLYISPAHNYFGHHGKPPGGNPTLEVPEFRCVAGRGIEGDRFFDYKDAYKGQITFFDQAVYDRLCAQLGVQDRSPDVFRRNVFCAGVDLNGLIGKDFEVQGVLFRGREECRPCYWMDQAFGPGAEHALRGQGGLRAEILSDGLLKVDTERNAPTADLAVAVGVSL
jgi:hypothetical protein